MAILLALKHTQWSESLPESVKESLAAKEAAATQASGEGTTVQGQDAAERQVTASSALVENATQPRRAKQPRVVRKPGKPGVLSTAGSPLTTGSRVHRPSPLRKQVTPAVEPDTRTVERKRSVRFA